MKTMKTAKIYCDKLHYLHILLFIYLFCSVDFRIIVHKEILVLNVQLLFTVIVIVPVRFTMFGNPKKRIA